jgi:phosphatidylserine decarboxylase
MTNNNSPIAVEGVPFIAVAGGLTLLCAAIHWQVAAICLLAITLFIVYFFRNPRRNTPADERAVIAPADGVIVYLGPASEEHLAQECLKISIFMSVFNVHINRAPLTGRVVDSFHIPGKFLDVRDERATFENERSGIVLETAEQVRIVVVQVAGLIARRIVCYLRIGDSIERGQRYGLIRFGSRLDVYLPMGTELKVKMGDKTVSGETVLGYLT